jgi:hypothetical protein
VSTPIEPWAQAKRDAMTDADRPEFWLLASANEARRLARGDCPIRLQQQAAALVAGDAVANDPPLAYPVEWLPFGTVTQYGEIRIYGALGGVAQYYCRSDDPAIPSGWHPVDACIPITNTNAG